MPAVSLAKALKLKNRLAGRLNAVQTNIRSHNSVLEEQQDRVNVPNLIKEYENLVEALISLKTSIIRANTEIQNQIIRKGELKSKIEFLNSLNTNDGVQRHGYQNTEIKYVATIKLVDVTQQVRKLEAEIDLLQDQLDEFNQITKINVPQAWLDLAS
jgi:predicted  nucleic acid-binding Zn-ribbon protein